MSANSKQYGGSHYQCQAIQPWDYVTANNLGYLEGTAIKYITRWRHKNGTEDIRKAIHFLEKLLEVESTRSGSASVECFSNLGAVVREQQPVHAGSSFPPIDYGSTAAGTISNVACPTDWPSSDNSMSRWNSFFSNNAAKRVVGGFCDVRNVDGEAWHSQPFPAWSLNAMPILRADGEE